METEQTQTENAGHKCDNEKKEHFAVLQRIYKFFKEKNLTVLQWTIPLKLALSALLGALGGAGLIAVLSEYATYTFSIYYGFRPPLEGVQYLKAGVSVASFSLLLTGSIVFLLSILFVKTTIWQFEILTSIVLGLAKRVRYSELQKLEHNYKDVLLRLSERPYWQKALFSVTTALVTGVLARIIFGILIKNFEEMQNFEIITASIFSGLFSLVISISLSRKNSIWWIGGIVTLIYFIAWISVLFIPSWYAKFLRTVGYGGGIPVAIELVDENSKFHQQEIEGFLLIRTTEAVILLDKDSRNIIEIPREKIHSLSHSSGGLWRIDHALP